MSPVAIVGSKHPELIKDLQKISDKWEKRTTGLKTALPKAGTFDVNVCENMELKKKDYKSNDKSKKRQTKRELELQLIKLFKSEGQ